MDNLHANHETNVIADQHVQNPVIPPALCEIGQLMFERVFEDYVDEDVQLRSTSSVRFFETNFHTLKHDTQDPADPIVTKHERLHHPSEHVREHKFIHLVLPREEED